MITLAQYFGPWFKHPDATPAKKENAQRMLYAVNKLMCFALEDGVKFPVNPSTGSQISGTKYGGFRPLLCTIGAARSSHKTGMGVDIYDPKDEIDAWCMKHLDKLEACGIYIEHPSATESWCHMTTKAPGSGNRVFYP